MRLTKLELSGFKSFADTVQLSFEDGITAIVGPNGCGKSNVSDAVRWVLGEQSARLLRGGKMEDVIFQGAASRRQVNVTEVSLYLDNSDGTLPVAFQEVVITRRLSRSGQSDYLLNGSMVRLRDVKDLLRGTGLGSDAGVVIEMEMIKALLSDRADERRSLFEEAAGIGLYRDRKQSSERRLEETAHDLQRVEDLIAEVQSQLRSLARQKGKAERHSALTEERFAVQVTLAKRLLDRLDEESAGMRARHEELAQLLPEARERQAEAEFRREEAARARATAEEERTEVARRLAFVRLELERVERDLALATERRSNIAERRRRAGEERALMDARANQASIESEAATADRAEAQAEHEGLAGEQQALAAAEETERQHLAEARQRLRTVEQEAQAHAQATRALAGERASLERDLTALRERAAQAVALRAQREGELGDAERRRDSLVERAAFLAYEAQRAAAAADAARHALAEAREHEARDRAQRRSADEAVAQLAARRQALEELERDRVGLAPAAAALLSARGRFGDAVLGPLSDFCAIDGGDADVAERLLGDWMHAIVVRDRSVLPALQAWHDEAQPGAIMVLPLDPGPSAGGDAPLPAGVRAEGAGAAWVRAAIAGSEAMDARGRMLRRASGAIVLAGQASASGPLRRRAELASLATDLAQAEAALASAHAALEASTARLAAAEQAHRAANDSSERAGEVARQSAAQREEAQRAAATFARELEAVQQELTRHAERTAAAEARLAAIGEESLRHELATAQLEEALGAARAGVQGLEAALETARERRVQGQVQQAHVTARLRSADERLQRAGQARADALRAATTLADELSRLATDDTSLASQVAQWTAMRAERRVAVLELEAAAADAKAQLAAADAALVAAEATLVDARDRVTGLGDERHQLELTLTETTARRRSIVERVEQEWRRPLAELVDQGPLLDLDLESLEQEAHRIFEQLEQIGTVNPLAVEEHAEEARRLAFLTSQRDDLVSARQSLLQAIREIDGTARQMFLETFAAVQVNFQRVFQTLFGGGECDLRLANPEEPLDCEIEILAAPRGKKVQRIHLLSSGERTLVATSLLFGIYLTKPSPFCLMDEVDAPLDDANVGRFCTLLEEFKGSTQFLVITHNPRTMQAADAVYGVTMQEPGVSTIVGVRLGQAAEAARA